MLPTDIDKKLLHFPAKLCRDLGEFVRRFVLQSWEPLLSEDQVEPDDDLTSLDDGPVLPLIILQCLEEDDFYFE